MDATLKQVGKILSLFEDTPREQIQALLASGLLADLRDANIGEVSRKEFRQLVGLEPKIPVIPKFEVFKTIKLGTGLKSADDFRVALKDGGFRISRWASDILDMSAFTAVSQKTEVDLVVVSVAELGFKNGASRSEIYKCAEELGLEICPPEVGPQLCLQLKDQPSSELLFIGMEPIFDSDGYPSVFIVGHYGNDPRLDSHRGRSDNFWGGDFCWVFLRRR